MANVFLTSDTARDLDLLYDYLTEHDGSVKADHALGKIENVLQSLSESPDRGSFPKELSGLGIKEFREFF